MQEIVKIETETLNGVEQETVDARELWKKLESKQEFSNWIKKRTEKFGFKEGIDFGIDKIIKPTKQHNGKGVATSYEYTLSLRMAEHLALMENTAKGREIRDYFITVEKKARELQAKLQPMLDQLTDYNEYLKLELAKKDRLLQLFEPTGFGDISETTGLPKTHKIKAHCRSSRKNYRLMAVDPQGKYVQLELPIFCSDQIAG